MNNDHPDQFSTIVYLLALLATAIIFAAVMSLGLPATAQEPPTVTPVVTPNAGGWYHAYLCPADGCEHRTTRRRRLALEWAASPTYRGGTWNDIKEHPASLTPRIWGNSAPGRP